MLIRSIRFWLSRAGALRFDALLAGLPSAPLADAQRITMKRLVWILLGVPVALLVLVVPAHAITITEAFLDAGTVTVSGNKAAKSSPISWEGSTVTTSTKGGVFNFTTAVVPEDCVGTLGDGVSTVEVAIAGCPLPSTFPATGQTTCWNSAGAVIDCANTEHDGDLRAGAALNYTDNGDGTITDNNTGLMWAKKSDDGTIHDKDRTYTWANAFAVHIAGLNTLPCFAGYCDWRLPNIKELQSIVNYENRFPAVSPAFNNCAVACTVTACSCTEASGYWSSTSYVSGPSLAWLMDFSVGFVDVFGKSNIGYVRAVRGGS